jgi:hypothetical protein
VFNGAWDVTHALDGVRINRDESDMPGGRRRGPQTHAGVVENRFDVIEVELRNEKRNRERKSNS